MHLWSTQTMCWRFGVLEASSSFQAALVNCQSGSNFGNLTSHWQLRDLKWLLRFERHSRQVNSDCSYNENVQNTGLDFSEITISTFNAMVHAWTCNVQHFDLFWNCTWYIKWYIHYKTHRIYYVSLCGLVLRHSTCQLMLRPTTTTPPVRFCRSRTEHHKKKRTSFHKDNNIAQKSLRL